MRSLIIGIATLAMATVAATPAISASYESGYLGQAMAATGLIHREEMPTCRATVSEGEDALAIFASGTGTFREMRQFGEGREAWFCLN
jgi:hypothetical protein